jgi:hypothetical protein
VLAPLVETVREQAETIGSLRAQLAAADERIRMLDAPGISSLSEEKGPEPAPDPEPPPQPNGREFIPPWRRVMNTRMWLGIIICALIVAYLLAQAAFVLVDIALPHPF